jgi:biopolymer transport protein TolR
MAFSMGDGGASRPQINVTPLIDVLLTLIVMFMLAVSMEQEHGEVAQIPQPQPDGRPVSQPERTVIVQIASTAKDQPPNVKINRDEVQWDELETHLAQIYLTRAEKVAFVRGDPDVDFQYVADVIDFAHHAGVQRVGLLTKDRMIEGE